MRTPLCRVCGKLLRVMPYSETSGPMVLNYKCKPCRVSFFSAISLLAVSNLVNYTNKDLKALLREDNHKINDRSLNTFSHLTDAYWRE